jgi:hypothetical protein
MIYSVLIRWNDPVGTRPRPFARIADTTATAAACAGLATRSRMTSKDNEYKWSRIDRVVNG